MELKNIEAFLKAKEAGSFSLAAEMLFVSQSTISTRIKNLERELNTQLFIRYNGNKVILSKTGEKLYPSLKEGYTIICNSVKELIPKSPHVKAYKISLPGHMAEHLLQELSEFIDQNITHYDISLRITKSYNVVESVLNDEIDIGFAYLDSKPDTDQVQIIHIANLETVLVCSQDNPILRTRSAFRLVELKNKRIIIYHKTFLTYLIFEKFIRQLGLADPLKTIEIQKLELIKKLMMEQQDIALLQKVGVGNELKNGTLVEIPVELPIPPTPMYLIFNKNVPNNLLQIIVAWAQKSL